MSLNKQVKQLALCISCHAWNKDGTQVALCPNNNEIHIYSYASGKFERLFVLKEHDQLVTGIDWAPETNRIVSCSQDRNAYVWQYLEDTKTWKPTLVILRINRAATCVRWSPKEDKFAVASGAKVVSVCYFEEVNDWWVSKHIKKHRSSVLSVAWHPSNLLLATGCSDFKARIFSAAIKGVDKKAPTPFGEKPAPFGELLAEFDSETGWVHGVAWTSSGNTLAYVGHDSSVNFVPVITETNVQKIKLNDLPFRQCAFLDEDKCICVGYDCNPILFVNEGGVWKMEGKVDREQKKETKKAGGTAAAFAMFQQQTTRGTTTTESKLDTEHQNAISVVQVLKDAGGGVTHFSTSGIDGKVVLWEAKSLASVFSGLKI